MPGFEAPESRQFVTALARGLELLRCFRPDSAELTNQLLARRSGLPRPTVSRLTYTLRSLGYLDYDEQTGKYRLGPGVLALGYATLAGVELRDVARPHMQRLADETGVAVSLGRRDRYSMVYLEHARSGRGVLTLGLSVGDRIPLMTTSMGRAYLNALPADAREPLLESLRRRFPNEWTLFEPQWEAAQRDYAEHGCCFALGDWHEDIHAAGIALPFGPGQHVYGFNCGGPAFRLTRRYLIDEVAPRLREMARALTEAHVTGDAGGHAATPANARTHTSRGTMPIGSAESV